MYDHTPAQRGQTMEEMMDANHKHIIVIKVPLTCDSFVKAENVANTLKQLLQNQNYGSTYEIR